MSATKQEIIGCKLDLVRGSLKDLRCNLLNVAADDFFDDTTPCTRAMRDAVNQLITLQSTLTHVEALATSELAAGKKRKCTSVFKANQKVGVAQPRLRQDYQGTRKGVGGM